MRRRRYPSDLTDPQWALLVPHIPPAKAGGRPRTTDSANLGDLDLHRRNPPDAEPDRGMTFQHGLSMD